MTERKPTLDHRDLTIAISVLSIACVLVFAPDAYLPMLARSFMLWWVFGFFAVIVFAVLRRRWYLLQAATFAALMVGLQVVTPDVVTPSAVGPHALRIAHMNVLQPNAQKVQVINNVLALDADLISVQEVSPEWAVALTDAFERAYPYQRVVPGTNCYGIALFSRFPFEKVGTLQVQGTPFIDATVQVNGTIVRVLAMHANSPGSYMDFKRRNAQLAVVSERVRSNSTPTVVVGDLNTVHWDQAYERFCARGGVRPINSPFTITWPSLGPLAMIPLDHVLVNDGLKAGRLASFEVEGSDHRGLLAELHIDDPR